jgi:hypothetical protein
LYAGDRTAAIPLYLRRIPFLVSLDATSEINAPLIVAALNGMFGRSSSLSACLALFKKACANPMVSSFLSKLSTNAFPNCMRNPSISLESILILIDAKLSSTTLPISL